METVRLAFRAMATRFEFILLGDDVTNVRAAGEEAMREVVRIEERCNYYAPSSELSHLNRKAGRSEVRCSGMMMRLLKICRDLHEATQGCFDPSVAPALARWGLREREGAGRVPSAHQLHELTSWIGFEHVDLDDEQQTVRFSNPDLKLDLGGIAKGWALDEARLLLEESGVIRGLLHGGTSTALAMGNNADDQPWTIGIEDPYEQADSPLWLTTLSLSSTAMSVSGVQGKSFVDEFGKTSLEYGHVINPASGRAVSGPRLALAVSESAAASDAWSTALLAAPTRPVPPDLQGTAYLKTDSGWTVTTGEAFASRLPTGNLPSSDSLS